MERSGTATPAYLTQPETAELLRCSTSKVSQLRFSGKLAYIPGRPVLIEESDIRQYLDSYRCDAIPHKSQIAAREAAARTTSTEVTVALSESPAHAMHSMEYTYVPKRSLRLTLFTIPEAAIELGLSQKQLRRRMKHRNISYIPGRPVMFEQSDIDGYRNRLAAIARAKLPPEPGSPEALAAQRADTRRWLAMTILKDRWRAENKRMKLAAQTLDQS
jgi:hypothetical protein